jgi:DNA-binding Lrp family transcriptional regulator
LDSYPRRDPLRPANRLGFYLSASRAFLGHLQVAQAALALDAIDVIIGYAIVQAGVDHLDQPGGEGRLYARLDTPPPDDSRRPISVSALARSLSLPRETVRRRADHLLERAIVSRDERGLSVTTAFLTTPTYQTIVFSQMEPILGFLLKLGYPDDPEMGDARAWLDHQSILDRARQFGRIVLRVQLRHYETLARLGGDLHSGLLLSLILSNAGAAEGEAGQDGATSRLQLAEALTLNRESTRRRLVSLARSGAIVRTSAGYRPSPELLSGPRLEAALSDTSLNIRQMVRLLAVHGFVHEPHPAAGIAGRPLD